MGDRRVIILETMYDNGEQEPHVAETCGVFADEDGVASYVESRFREGFFEARRYADQLSWTLHDRKTGEESDLVLVTRDERFYGAAAPDASPPPATGDARELLADLEGVCSDIFERWDEDMRSGKLLRALSGAMLDYDPRVTRIRAALSRPPQPSVLPEEVAAMCEKLRRVHPKHGNYGLVSPGAPVNPDGPEAVTVIEALSSRAQSGEVERLREALETIASGNTTTFDDDLQRQVVVPLDANEMSEIARSALGATASLPCEEMINVH